MAHESIHSRYPRWISQNLRPQKQFLRRWNPLHKPRWTRTLIFPGALSPWMSSSSKEPWYRQLGSFIIQQMVTGLSKRTCPHIIGPRPALRKNLTQRRTTLLLVGETDKTTRQLANAIEYGKPIFPAAQFFTWVDQQGSCRTQRNCDTADFPDTSTNSEVSQTRPAAASPSPSQAQPPPPPVVHFLLLRHFRPPAPRQKPQYAPSDKPAGPGLVGRASTASSYLSSRVFRWDLPSSCPSCS